MQKYAIDFADCDPEEGTGCGNGASMWPNNAGEYYLASDVDARIAELEKALRTAVAYVKQNQGGWCSPEYGVVVTSKEIVESFELMER